MTRPIRPTRGRDTWSVDFKQLYGSFKLIPKIEHPNTRTYYIICSDGENPLDEGKYHEWHRDQRHKRKHHEE